MSGPQELAQQSDAPPAPTVDPRVAGVLLVGFEGTTAPDWVRRWAAQGLAGVCLFARNCLSPEQVAALVASLRAERPELLVAIDEEGGAVTRLEAQTGSTLPGNAVLGVLDDPAATSAAAAVAADRLRAVGIDLNLAPVADVNVNPRNPVIGTRSFGADPELVARHVAAYVQGLQSRGVAACAKHFPGHGDTSVDSHVGVPTVDHDRVTLEEVDLAPFRAAVSAGSRAIMTAHLHVPALDSALATLSRPILTGLLRESLGFSGVIATDALEMRAVAGTVGIAEGAALSLAAGADLVCTGLRQAPGQLAADGLLRALEDGRLAASRLEEARARVRDLAAWCLAGRQARYADPPHLDLVQVVRGAAVRHDPHGRLPLSAPVVVAEVSSPVFTGTGGAGAQLGPALAVRLDGHAAGGAGAGQPARSSAEAVESGSVVAGPLVAGPVVTGPVVTVPVHGEPARVGEALAAARDAALVAVVRDLSTAPASREALDRLLAERPDTVVVLTGLPGDVSLLPPGCAHVAVHAPGATHLAVAAELLTR
ncbi:MAG TPA: beta-N-acetylhexosaminidase [Segeticoccus sp.]|uniref:beta-N-acetylhexosaminidase n=1 Tax=Segeticoccus sp. TaxID=2706531 RepID=UPI002D7F68CE|nr:beta-N-acetylhexosaminidase [Segeticoccus sp.]HET8600383.1 beta-N-acetylhexosaminidase [Segeticoccus sp.]